MAHLHCGTLSNGQLRKIPKMMWRFILIRTLKALFQLLLTSLLAFIIIKSAPGDPIASLVGGRKFMTDYDYERVAHNLGLDQPIAHQYGAWLVNLFQGDWGHSIRDGRIVSTTILQYINATLLLIGISCVFMIGIAIFAGCWAGLRARSSIDYIISSFSLISSATPAFWLGLLLILLFSVSLNWLPSSGQLPIGSNGAWSDYLAHLVLPVSCIVLTHIGPYIRLIRGSVQDVLTTDYYRAARARGLPQHVLIKNYILPNALTPFIIWIGLTFPLLVGGTFIVEWVFGWPGIGRLFLQVSLARDYPMIMGIVIVTSALVIIGNLLADMLVLWLNPRLRRQNPSRHNNE